LVIHIILLAIVVAFVALNVGYTTSINLFGYMFSNISTVAVTLVAFIVGIIYSFFYYVLNYFNKSGKQRVRERSKKAKDKEKVLKEKEEELKDSASSKKEIASPAAESSPQPTVVSAEKPKKKSRLFGKK
jgi:phosphotransferase system  glucose/maltose/N-acetylglucosamine-specific IIC component